MKHTLAFDVYGTLINTSGVLETLEGMIGKDAGKFMNLWRNKQLEYSFRRGLMDAYVDFSICTAQALDYCCAFLEIDLNKSEKDELTEAYKVLPAFEDIKSSLTTLKDQGYPMYAFSNGSTEAVNGLLNHSGIQHFFDGVVSAENVSTFKPNPKVYEHFNTRTKTKPKESILISGNSFDCIGALHYGMHAIWVPRSSGSVFDPWDISPTATISDLNVLPEILEHIDV